MVDKKEETILNQYNEIIEKAANMIKDRRVKRPEKEKQLIEKLGEDKYHWSYNIQTRPTPSWTEAFEYAYKLGLERGIYEYKDCPGCSGGVNGDGNLLCIECNGTTKVKII